MFQCWCNKNNLKWFECLSNIICILFPYLCRGILSLFESIVIRHLSLSLFGKCEHMRATILYLVNHLFIKLQRIYDQVSLNARLLNKNGYKNSLTIQRTKTSLKISVQHLITKATRYNFTSRNYLSYLSVARNDIPKYHFLP